MQIECTNTALACLRRKQYTGAQTRMPTSSNTIASKLAISQIAPTAVQSEIRAMTIECDRVGGINLAQGVCDTEMPAPVSEAAIRAIRDGHNIYTRMDGIAALRQAIALKQERHSGLRCNPDTEILVTSGATGGFLAACMALLNPGDEVLLFEPFYGYHRNTLQCLRMTPVVVPLTAPRWDLDIERAAAAITPRTRALILNTPGNPSGKIFTRAELEAIAQLAEQHDLFVITDEIYEYFVYGGARHISIATLPAMADRTITLSGFSKTFSVTGWRLGYLSASSRWLPAISFFHDMIYVCAPAPLQHGAAAGLLQLPDAFYADLATEYEKKRDIFCEALNDAGMACVAPDGAYYVLADAAVVPGATAREKARNLLRETGVAAVAGTAFFADERGENLLRFCFAKKQPELLEACARLRAYS